MANDQQQLIRKVKKLGFCVEQGRHMRILNQDGQLICTIACTPGRGSHALRNYRARLRRHGIMV